MPGTPKKRAKREAAILKSAGAAASRNLEAERVALRERQVQSGLFPDLAPLPGSMSVAEAAQELAVDAQPEPAPPETPAIDWALALEPGFRALIGYLEARQPRWATSDAELRALTQAWAPIAALYMGTAGPWTTALLATAAWAAPRLNWKRARETTSNSHASPRPEGEREEFSREASGSRP